MKKIFLMLLSALLLMTVGSSCKKFVFGEVVIEEENNPFVEKKFHVQERTYSKLPSWRLPICLTPIERGLSQTGQRVW